MKIIAVCIVAVVAGVVDVTSGLQCYKCTYETGTADSSCVTGNRIDDASMETCVTATKCYTERTVDAASNEIKSVRRGCDEAGDKSEACTRDDVKAEETCTTLCDGGDLCNTDNVTTIPNDFVWCYSCLETYNPSINQTCLSKPEEQSKIKCYAPRTCFTKSQSSPSEGVMRSFLRGCEDYSNHLKQCTKPAGGWEDCLSVCCSDYCNDGSGRTSGTDASCMPPTQAPPQGGLQCSNCNDETGAADSWCLTGNRIDDATMQTCVTATKCYTERTVDAASNEIKSVRRGCDEAGDKMEACTRDDAKAEETCTTLCDGGDLCNTDNVTTIPNDFVWCYDCETHNQTNPACWTESEKQPVIKCYVPRTCFTKGQWSSGGVLSSFTRGCEDYQVDPKQCTKPVGGLEDCLSVCCSDHCNGGNGWTSDMDASCFLPTQAPTPTPAPDSAAPALMYGPVLVVALAALTLV